MATSKNVNLERLYRETGWSLRQFAQEVNRLGTERGTPLKYREPSVHQWLNGHMPKEPVRPLVLEALSRRLGRPVTPAQAGFPAPAPDGTGAGPSTVDNVLDLSSQDMDPSRRAVLGAGMYSAALAVPRFSDLAGRVGEEAKPGRTVRIGPSDVAAVRMMTEKIADILDELGGGHARPMAAAFLVNTVTPYLRATATEKVRKDMLSAASDLVYLTGWMAMYERAHGLGQRYYTEALKLAGEAEDHITYCRTLRGMSLQASNLGHGTRALHLADSAAEASPKAGPRLRAFLAGQQAHAAAMTGDRTTALARLRETESALSKADSRRDAVGGYDTSAYYFHVSHVLYENKDLPGSIHAMRESLKAQPHRQRQGRVHSNGVLARRQFELGHLDAACATWHEFLDDYAEISTARGDEHFAAMRRSIAPYRRAGAVRDLAQRARDIALAKGVGR
ncbi:hypothetical protein [Streptomyces sp. UNOC14_S4]|uniref:hypothetical protein n=1 Tax=Streptomyces sp. UNOC14_S4 TaxID=2872340 RepID=UPI001E2D1B5E|nr:hypothetical protein [Streptomyces sp. UNOC14_S4]MCC3769338.1 hypothetical protein [Streptomyces sp. UNOC14_S4]